jgi:hypothetical protein
MCKAFSGYVTRSGRTAWKMGLDSHDSIYEAFKDTMPEIREYCQNARGAVKFEITPENGNYFDEKSPWIFRLDEDEKPEWFTSQHEAAAMQAMREWREKLYGIVDIQELEHLVNPFSCEPHAIDDEVLALVSQWQKAIVRDTVWDTVWATVGATVGDTVWDTVRDTVGATVGATVGDTAWATVWNTVWDTVWAYTGSLFPGAWKDEYPYSASVKLWKIGLVICSDRNTWYLISKNGIEWSRKTP